MEEKEINIIDLQHAALLQPIFFTVGIIASPISAPWSMFINNLLLPNDESCIVAEDKYERFRDFFKGKTLKV